LKIDEKIFGPEHIKMTATMDGLASLYSDLGKLTEAESLYKRSLKIREKTLGPEHPDLVYSFNNLAVFYASFGDNTKAESLYKRCIEMLENVFGPDHPDIAMVLSNQALLYASLDKYKNAFNVMKKVQQIDEKIIDEVMTFTTENRAIKFLSTRKSHFHTFIGFVSQYMSSSPSAIRDAFDVWLKRKAFTFEAQRKLYEALLYLDDPVSSRTFQQLAATRESLSKLIFRGPGKAGVEVYQKKLQELEERKERLKNEIVKINQASAEEQKVTKTDSNMVAKVLPYDTVMLEIARIRNPNFKAKREEKNKKLEHYLVFVLHAGENADVRMIDLGEAKRIDSTIIKLKQIITKDGSAQQITEISKQLYSMVFAPIKMQLGNVKRIFISPDGDLNLIPFEILQSPDNRFLIEDYEFNYLSAGRDIVGFCGNNSKSQKTLIMGDPDFDLNPDDINSTMNRSSLKYSEEINIAKRSIDMKGVRFARLPGTKEEVTTIHALLGKDQAELYTGKEALEEVLRKKGTPRILHLATHGFFLEDLDLSRFDNESRTRGVIGFSPQTPIQKDKKNTRINLKDVNPLLRSGIALAGANRALTVDDVEKCDGIVTAEKILGLRLQGTEMVVLSACDTGIGEVKAGEGVYGLRRAFSQAGAKSLVMSMWQVPDRETKELMINFYKNLQSGKLNRCDSLRQASLKQMRIVKKRYGHANPFYWGAFVFLGEP
jgi:CHAT domain-containing protein